MRVRFPGIRLREKKVFLWIGQRGLAGKSLIALSLSEIDGVGAGLKTDGKRPKPTETDVKATYERRAGDGVAGRRTVRDGGCAWCASTLTGGGARP